MVYVLGIIFLAFASVSAQYGFQNAFGIQSGSQNYGSQNNGLQTDYFQNLVALYKSLNPQQEQQFSSILNNNQESYNQQMQQFQQLGSQLNGQQRQLFNTWFQEQQQVNQEIIQSVQQSLSQLSPQAQSYGQQILQIVQNNDLSKDQTEQQIMQVISQAPQSVQQELQGAMFQFILNIIQWGIQSLQQLGSNGLTALQSIEQGPNQSGPNQNGPNQQNGWWNSQTNGNQNGIGYRHKRNTHKKGKKHVRVYKTKSSG